MSVYTRSMIRAQKSGYSLLLSGALLPIHMWQWHALNKAIFSYDATAAKQARMDYQGGSEGSGFYLRNTGFFTGPTKLHSEFERPVSQAPEINLSALPNN